VEILRRGKKCPESSVASGGNGEMVGLDITLFFFKRMKQFLRVVYNREAFFEKISFDVV